jgi:DNA polymerase-3 subunit epsilon
MIQALQPRFNRQAKAWRKYCYLKLTDDRFPRLMVTRAVPKTGTCCVGPLPSTAAAHLVREAIETALPLRRCTLRTGRRAAVEPGMPCVAAQLGVAVCPCRGQVDDAEYEQIVATARHGLEHDPTVLLAPLEARMERLARAERFEEAAATRDRLAALSRALHRRRVVEQLQATQRLLLDTPEGRMELRSGRLVLPEDIDAFEAPPAVPVAREHVDELLVVARWLSTHAHQVRVVTARGSFASAVPKLPTYVASRSVAAAVR